MTERNPPVWMQSGTYNAIDDRMVTGLLSDRDTGASGNGQGIGGGVIPGFDSLAVTAPGNNMTATVGTGAVIIPTTGTSPPGAYLCYNAGAMAFTFDIASTGNPRIDVLYAAVEDQTTGGAKSEWRFGVAKGQPSAAPATPALLAGQFPIAAVKIIPAAQQTGGTNKILTTNITDLRVFNAGMGGVHQTKNNTPLPPHQPGRLLYNVDSDFLWISDGATWNYFYTYQAWMSLFESLRPKHASNADEGTIATGATANKKWDATPPTTSTTTSGGIAAVTIPDMRSPSGNFKVSISAFGKTLHGTGSGHVSVRVLNGTTTVFEPGTGWRAIGFYLTAWEHHGTTFLVTGMAKDTPLTFRVEYSRWGVDANTVSFKQPYLMVEPVL